MSAFPALQLNQYAFGGLEVAFLVHTESKARWRRMVMLSMEDTFGETAIAQRLYIDINSNPRFEVELHFEVAASSFTDSDAVALQYAFGDLFALKFVGSVNASSDLMATPPVITVTVSMENVTEIEAISDSVAAHSVDDEMESLLTDIEGVDDAQFMDFELRTS